MTLESIRYKRGQLHILDQLRLPKESVYEEIKDVDGGWHAIKSMKVRGAPAIAIVGCLSLAVELGSKSFEHAQHLFDHVEEKLNYLVTARPTAINMAKTAGQLMSYCESLVAENVHVHDFKEKVIHRIEKFLEKDLSDNKSIGEHGSLHILSHPLCEQTDGKFSVLTHCNTGSLATSGYGTALGVIRSLHARGVLDHVYCTETRPYNQGARLTAYELAHENIPATLIADSMASLLMKTKKISAVIVGADRVAKNGDTANKIGTYQLAVVAKHHGVPFLVAAPYSSIDHDTEEGDHIEIEFRPDHELTSINGVKIAADGVGYWNPAFDVTPFELVTGGIVTEHGVITEPEQLHTMPNGK